MTLSRSKMSVLVYVIALLTIIAGILASIALRGATPHAHATKAEESGGRLVDCAESSFCTEVADPASAFPRYNYVGHDEPSNLFYSNVDGSGNNNQWRLKLPSDPTPKPNGEPREGQSFNFQLHPAFWFGMAMCDTQSYPEQVSTCTPDSDSNIFNNPDPNSPDFIGKHPGTAFMEMQFYPPGWVAPEFLIGTSCTATQWCAAITIDSLAQDPINGTSLNSTCASQLLGGLEYINFALITKSGVPQAPVDPLHSNLGSFTADPSKDLLMNSGDNIVVTMGDTANGLHIALNDLTSGQSGSMTASAANGFGQIQYAPTGTSCNVIPYDFHPMYSTSSPDTRVIWAAHSYNIAFSDEIGHFDYCTAVNTFGGNCLGQEGLPPSLYPPGDLEKADGDDQGCFNKHSSTLVRVTGCTFTNSGFDGVPYQKLWPDGSSLHPTPIQFSSPLIGPAYTQNYSRSAFEADLPRIEDPTVCHRLTDGSGCTLIPTTDDNHAPAVFYPYYSITSASLGITTCAWQLGALSGSNDFGKNSQYGKLLPLVYLTFGGGGKTNTRFNDFRQILDPNPCPVG